MALIRYPGSKEKLARDLWRMFPDEMTRQLWSNAARWEYREPFFGAGAIGFKILEQLDRRCSVWLNDLDEDLVLLWRTVKENPKPLLRLITDFEPSVEKFYQFKADDGKRNGSDAQRGFRKLALHRMSVSGFGVMSGGPIGGRTQKSSAYTVGCRWNPERMKCDVTRLSNRLNKFASLRITCGDFAPLIENSTEETFVYLDPPYYEKGSQLYRYGMSEADHSRLSPLLESTNCRWVLSYDDHPRIRQLYHWAAFTDLHITYTNAVTASVRPKNREVAITPLRKAVAS